MFYFLTFFLIILSFTSVKATQIIWADTLIAVSSEYYSEKNKKAYSAQQALLAPDAMPATSTFFETSWSPAREDSGTEFIHVGFKNPIRANKLIINEPVNAGSIVSIDFFDANNNKLFNLTERNGFKQTQNTNALVLPFQLSKMPIAQVKLTLNTTLVKGYNQIDAIGLTNSNEQFKIAVNVVKDEHTNKKELLGPNVNSQASELLPQISPDGKVLYFTRQDHPQNLGYSNGQAKQNIWKSVTDKNGYFQPATLLPAPINNVMHNSLCSITPDGQKILILNVYLPDGGVNKGISFSYLEGTNWSFPEPVSIDNYYNNNIYGEYCLSVSGRILIMTIERDDTYGLKDVYVSFLKQDNTWTEPLNLGPNVNTVSSEVSPFIAADEKTLYYATAGKLGYGRQDIYVTRRLDDTWTNWSEPENLGPTINTPFFDAYYSIPASGDYAYFSSTNNENREDIFRIKLPEQARPTPVVLVKGNVYNAKTNEPIAATILYESLTTGKEIGEARSSKEDGYYSIVLSSGDNYGFRANVKGFASINQNIDLSKLDAYKEINKDLYLVPVEQGQIIKLNNIFFEYNKFEINKETTLELDRLVQLMNEYPNMTIEIGGHTDNLGSDQYNLALSRNRAKAVYNYLISKQINKKRLSYKGYGKTKPLFSNDTEEGRQENRRVEFKIIKL